MGKVKGDDSEEPMADLDDDFDFDDFDDFDDLDEEDEWSDDQDDEPDDDWLVEGTAPPLDPALVGRTIEDLGTFLSTLGTLMQAQPAMYWMPKAAPDKYPEREAKAKLKLILKSILAGLKKWSRENAKHERKEEVDDFRKKIEALVKLVTSCEINIDDVEDIQKWVKKGTEAHKPPKPLKDVFGKLKFSHWDPAWGKDVPPDEKDFETWFNLITAWARLIWVKNKWGYPNPRNHRWKPRFRIEKVKNTLGEEVHYVTITVYRRNGKSRKVRWPVDKTQWKAAEELVKGFNAKFKNCKVFPKRGDAQDLDDLSRPKVV